MANPEHSKKPFTYPEQHNIPIGVREWVGEMYELCGAEDIHWVDGSEDENSMLFQRMVKDGMCIKLNEKLRPNSHLFRSDPKDVARQEKRTFICTPHKDDAGPTNNWQEATHMKTRLLNLQKHCMNGRVCYVIPFAMGPIDAEQACFGVQITDSPYVVVNMSIMTRVCIDVYEKIQQNTESYSFVKCMHSVLCPLEEGEKDVNWPCNPDNTYICHFPDDNSIVSLGSGYGGNALLAKKCFALRIASVIGKDNGWLAEHMAILRLEDKDKNKTYVTGAFPSQCGKTNFAMLQLPQSMLDAGYRVTVLGDDIAWLKPDKEGNLRAINPERGFFGVAPGTGPNTNYYALDALRKNAIFTNTAYNPKTNDIWWEGLSDPPENLIDWRGDAWTPQSSTPASHPNARFTVAVSNCQICDEDWDNVEGVPISAIIFGGRRQDMPVVVDTLNWQYGVYMGAMMASETTAASEDVCRKMRQDPMAMVPFCGYNIKDYFAHWLSMEKKLTNKPKIFHVNWFRKDANNEYIWPGFGENGRILKWVVDRVRGKACGEETVLGVCPKYDDIFWEGLPYTKQQWEQVTHIDPQAMKDMLLSHEAFFLALGYEKLPKEFLLIKNLLSCRL